MIHHAYDNVSSARNTVQFKGICSYQVKLVHSRNLAELCSTRKNAILFSAFEYIIEFKCRINAQKSPNMILLLCYLYNFQVYYRKYNSRIGKGHAIVVRFRYLRPILTKWKEKESGDKLIEIFLEIVAQNSFNL